MPKTKKRPLDHGTPVTMTGTPADIRKLSGLVQFEMSLTGVSAAAVADRAGVSPSTVRRLADGHTKSPHYRCIISILRALGYKIVRSKS